jgi:cyclopropane-fatty-acyl-phospholipid synthase
MTYTCACYPHADATLEEAQANKHRLVFDKLRLKAGDRLLDPKCWPSRRTSGAAVWTCRCGRGGSRRRAGWGEPGASMITA